MPKRGKHSAQSNAVSQDDKQNRSAMVFWKRDKFDKAVEGLGKSNLPRILTAMVKFETEWKVSATDEDISPGFDLKTLDALDGAYRLRQIRAGYDYRLTLLFIQKGHDAYWVHAWRKTRMNNKTEIELAKSRAADVWQELQGETSK